MTRTITIGLLVVLTCTGARADPIDQYAHHQYGQTEFQVCVTIISTAIGGQHDPSAAKLAFETCTATSCPDNQYRGLDTGVCHDREK
jgi:hypothetical protein